MYFSLRLSGFTVSSFDTTQQQILCTRIKQSWEASSIRSAYVECAVPSVAAYNASSVIATGYAYFGWRGIPSVSAYVAAQAVRDNTVSTLTQNPAALVGSSFPTAVPNCECEGTARITTSSTEPFSYSKDVLTLNPLPPYVLEANPMKCGARLTYNSVYPWAIVNQMGIDDGFVIAANRGKFCSSPPLTNGAVGVPGVGSCRQYGVLALPLTNDDPTRATVDSVLGITVTNGSITMIDFTGGNPGSGYTVAPTVTITAPNPIPVNALFTYNADSQPFVSLTPVANGPYVRVPEATSLGSDVCVDEGTGGKGVGALCTGPLMNLTSPTAGGPVTRTGRQCTVSDFNSGTACPAGGGPCILLTDLTVREVYYPGTANTYCSRSGNLRIIGIATAALQTPIIAVATAVLGAGGQISAILISNGGSGYTHYQWLKPIVTIGEPSITDGIGKLCSSSPIANLPNALPFPVANGVTVNTFCRPLGRDTYRNKPCSEPSIISSGVLSPLDTGTCNVDNSFAIISGGVPLGSATKQCGILPVDFRVTLNLSS